MFGTIPEFNQSLEMFKTMWGQNAAGQMPGQFPFTADSSKAGNGFAAAFPGLDVDELEKRIKDLKSVENWLNLNLNYLLRRGKLRRQLCDDGVLRFSVA